MPTDPITTFLTDAPLEDALVAAIYADRTVLDRVRDDLPPDAFTQHGIRAWYEAALIGSWDADVADYEPTRDPVGAARRLVDLSHARHLAGVAPRLSQQLLAFSRGEVSLSEVTAEFSAAAAKGAEMATPAQPLRPVSDLLADVVADARARYEHYQETGDAVMGLRTGISRLDDALGGLDAGRLTILMAAPNVGKTTLTNQIACKIAQDGTPVLFVSFENPPDDLIRKQLVRIGGFSALDVMRGRIAPDRITAAAHDLRRLVGDRLYYVGATAQTDVATIRGMAYRLKRRHPESGRVLIVIDYLQRLAAIKPPGDGRRGAGFDDLRGNVSRVIQEIRDMAIELESHVLAISSINRTGYANENSRAGLASAKESGDIEYSAEAVLILDEDKENTHSQPGMKPLRLRVEKNRFGLNGGLIPLMFDAARAQFSEIVPPSTFSGPSVNGRHASVAR